MPTYDYICLDCRRRFNLYLSYAEYGRKAVICPHCHGNHVQRRIGRIRFARSADSRLEDLADSSALAGLEDNPRALAKMMRQASTEAGEDLGPEFDEVVSRLESGQPVEEIEKDLPDLGGGETALPDEDYS